MFPKSKRKQDKELINYIKSLPCVVCGNRPVDPDHIGTKGAGHGDEEWNLWPLDRVHHIEKHAIGLSQFVIRYPHLKKILIDTGWELINGKWFHK